ncbi:VOC family protein [Streptomyces sp. NBC_01465]|uniref:VOC family protein n=1 Tax=Streptomyces sp. NBC_01465 TaxID=2903878 RepID=UPI002E336883|nr:VOC family protein [Streptomyces sp. NBC_01465]
MAVARLGTIALDCPDPRALAAFYMAVLGGTVKDGDGDDDEWVETAGYEGTPLAFQRVEGHVPPEWPSSEKSQQFHLDLTVEDQDAAETEVLALGATLLDKGEAGRTWRVYADPAGHPFCLCAC